MAASDADFSVIIAGLATAGLSQAEVARHAKVHRSTISKLALGDMREPTYSAGVRIVTLAEKHLTVAHRGRAVR
jgi:predicted XRE-type DNA-binding protein